MSETVPTPVASRSLKAFEPLSIRGEELQSRLIMSLFPSGQIVNGTHTGSGVEFFRARARDVGLMVIEGPSLDEPESGGSKLKLIGNELSASVLTSAIRTEGCLPLIQLSHSGSGLAGDGSGIKEASRSLVNTLTIDELSDIKKRFSNNAAAALKAGAAGVEVQAGYGHLLSQFLSPQTNRRTDGYGGDITGRSRFLLEVLTAVREALGGKGILQLKLCVEEFLPRGWRFSEARDLVAGLDPADIDIVLLTVGGKKNKELTIPTHFLPDGYLRSFSRHLKKVARVKIAVGEKIKRPELVERMLAPDTADLVAMSREFFAEPRYAVLMRTLQWEDIRPCISCNECTNKELGKKAGIKGRICNVNPAASQELKVSELTERAATRSGGPKNIAVIGGGPAGMQAAITLTDIGHKVSLFEAAPELGGSFRFAGLAPHKAVVFDILNFLKAQTLKRQIEVHTSSPVTDEFDVSVFDHILVSPGRKKAELQLAGSFDGRVLGPPDVFKDLESFVPSHSVVVLGGGSTGMEIAHTIAERLKGEGAVTVVEAQADVLTSMNKLTRKVLLSHLGHAGVEIICSARVLKMDGRSLVIGTSSGERTLPTDDLVIAVGALPDTDLFQRLQEKAEAANERTGRRTLVHLIGDAKAPGQIGSALRDALFTSLAI